jgi:4-hydroxybenzoate polyprenyltransferase
MAVGVYIVGVTWFARTEAGESRRAALLASSMVMLLGVILGAVTVFQAQGIASDGEPRAGNERLLFLGLLVAWAGVTGRPVLAAIAQPHPVRVQEAVKRCILGLIGLDALIAFGLIGWPGLLILLLLPPALLLGRWVYST